jgi:RNA polymerase sigma factor (sigma-70 family)
MQDRDIVAAIVAGENAGLVAAYDRYAPALHAYCRVLLREPADAADAVQDTFIIAAGKLDGLRDPDRLRPWLYAVARNECLRRLRLRMTTVPLEEAAADLTADEQGLEDDIELAELRALVTDALGGLSPGEREVLELNLRHELEGDDLASALGVSPHQAQALASRARTQFERSLGALLVARTGQESCWELAAILDGWDGRMNVLLRKRLNRHVERCSICGERRRHELSPAMLLSVLPAVLLPPDLRDQVLHILTEPSPAAYRQGVRVVRRAGRFDREGFPQPAGAPQGGRVRDHVLAGTGMLVFLAVLGIGTVFVLAALDHHPKPPVSALAIGPQPHLDPSFAGPGSTTAAASPGATTSSPAPSLTATLSPAPSTSASTGPPGPPSPSAPAPPSPPPSTSPPPTPTPSPSPSTTPPGLAVPAPTTVVLAQAAAGGPYSGSFTITAEGGPVDFTIGGSAPAGDLSISPADGSLMDGESVTVTVIVLSDGGLGFDTTLTLGPGGSAVDVQYPPAG